MLQGPARAWLNNLQPNSINSWLDFKEAFVRNFTSTYVRPSPARLLSLCTQRPDEPDHAYIKRWSELRNRCEIVPEVLAIQNFVDGVKDGTMLKHRLLLEEPSTVAEMMAIANKYAMVSASMKVQLRLDDDGRILNGDQQKAADRKSVV